MSHKRRVRVAVNGYGVIGKRVTNAITRSYRRVKIDAVWVSKSSRSSGSLTAHGSIEKTSGGITGPPATRSGR